jgi:pimeloyl-ACP methyl ester carboxylesterase
VKAHNPRAEAGVPSQDGAIAAPGALALLKEALTVFDVLAAVAASPSVGRLPDCAGERVLTFPGYGFGDQPLAPLRMQLRRLGVDASGWGLGRNDGHVETLLARARERVLEERARWGAPVTLIGWSLGGYIAREVARDEPAAVKRVVTLASPVVGGPRYTVVSGVFERLGYNVDRLSDRVEERRRVPIRVPVTALYSTRDGVVSWRACIDPARDSTTEHVAVNATHIGICFAPRVIELIADRLSRDARLRSRSPAAA